MHLKDSFATNKDYHEWLELPIGKRKTVIALRRYWRRELERYFAGGKFLDWWPSKRYKPRRKL